MLSALIWNGQGLKTSLTIKSGPTMYFYALNCWIFFEPYKAYEVIEEEDVILFILISHPLGLKITLAI
jgi:hypothetical protein